MSNPSQQTQKVDKKLQGCLVVSISSSALFDLSDSHRVFKEEGVGAYQKYQLEHEDVPLNPGFAFGLVKKLLALNSLEPARKRVEVILLSRNSADTGLRVFNSIRHHGLEINRAVFSGGERPYRYVAPFGSHLFLSSDPEDVRNALDAGHAAAAIISPGAMGAEPQLKIAFDGDAVLFSDEAERVYQQQGLEVFAKTENESAKIPLSGGPFKSFLSALHQIQAEFPIEDSPIRTALVTARAAPAHERVIRTLREWNIRIDEALFLGGLEKGPFLRAFEADFFFDDQARHCSSAGQHEVASGHVLHGVSNEPKEQNTKVETGTDDSGNLTD